MRRRAQSIVSTRCGGCQCSSCSLPFIKKTDKPTNRKAPKLCTGDEQLAKEETSEVPRDRQPGDEGAGTGQARNRRDAAWPAPAFDPGRAAAYAVSSNP